MSPRRTPAHPAVLFFDERVVCKLVECHFERQIVHPEFVSRVFFALRPRSFVDGANKAMTELPPEAAELVFALDRAASTVNPGKDASADRAKICSEFFRVVGREMGATTSDWSQERPANAIADVLATNQSGDWRRLDNTGKGGFRELQELANRGYIVIGVAKADPNGHVAVVAPVPPGLHLDNFGTIGPMVRDGNMYVARETKRVSPKDWGTVSASKAFHYGTNPPLWYVWRGPQ